MYMLENPNMELLRIVFTLGIPSSAVVRGYVIGYGVNRYRASWQPSHLPIEWGYTQTPADKQYHQQGNYQLVFKAKPDYLVYQRLCLTNRLIHKLHYLKSVVWRHTRLIR